MAWAILKSARDLRIDSYFVAALAWILHGEPSSGVACMHARLEQKDDDDVEDESDPKHDIQEPKLNKRVAENSEDDVQDRRANYGWVNTGVSSLCHLAEQFQFYVSLIVSLRVHWPYLKMLTCLTGEPVICNGEHSRMILCSHA